jgi:rod shape-determining protein MreD
MRKFAIGAILLVVFLFLLFLQVNIFPVFPIAGIVPNLFVIFVVFIGLFTNTSYGVGFGVFIGLVLDGLYGTRIGVTAVMLAIVGFVGAYFDKNFSKDSKITIIIMIALSTILFEFGKYVLTAAIVGYQFEWLNFVRILLIETLYNVLLSIIFYPLIKKAGFGIDRVFKKTNLLTRYF